MDNNFLLSAVLAFIALVGWAIRLEQKVIFLYKNTEKRETEKEAIDKMFGEIKIDIAEIKTILSTCNILPRKRK